MFRIFIGCFLAVVLYASRGDQPVRYDRASAVELYGRVEEVREVADPPGLSGVHFLVRSEKGALVDVYIAPSRFYRELSLKIGRGTEIRVRGSKLRRAGGDVLLAREIRWSTTNTLTLRDADGNPVW